MNDQSQEAVAEAAAFSGMQANERFVLGIAFLLLEMNSRLPMNLCSITDSISVEIR